MSLKPLILILVLGLVALIYLIQNKNPLDGLVPAPQEDAKPSRPESQAAAPPRTPPERVALETVKAIVTQSAEALLGPIKEGPSTINLAEIDRLRAEIIDYGQSLIGERRKEYANGVTACDLLKTIASERDHLVQRYLRTQQQPSQSSLLSAADRQRMTALELDRIEGAWRVRAEEFRTRLNALYQ